MSVIVNIEKDGNEPFIIICTSSWISKLFNAINNAKCKERAKLLHAVFEIRTPFLMDGEAKKISLKFCNDTEVLLNENSKRVLKNHFGREAKKRKFECPLTLMEKECVHFIMEKFSKVKETSEFKNYFSYSPTSNDFRLNNQVSRTARDLFLASTDVSILNVNGKNDTLTSVVHEYNGHKYLIPPECHYINGDVFDLPSFFTEELFDIVVMDPPWHNKHVRRKKRARGLSHSYNTLSVQEIMKISLLSVLSTDAFVFIWITNSSKINCDFLETLHLWDLELLTTWFWLKVTQAGNPVVSFDTSLMRGKLPYEKLLVTRRKGSKKNEKRFSSNLQNLVFCSVPSSIHSHKPPLKELLQRLLNVTDSERCLELFARCLTPGWTSLGKEVLKLQDYVLLENFQEMNEKMSSNCPKT